MTMASVAASAASSIHAMAAANGALTSGWFQNESLIIELVKGIPAAFVALIVGSIAAFIAWRQYRVADEQKRVARAKLNLDLFDRRLKIFQTTATFMSQSMTNTLDSPTVFLSTFAEVSFLFGSEVADYMELARVTGFDLSEIRRRAKAHDRSVMPEDVERNKALLRWFSAQISDGCRCKFAPYLDFGEWR